MTEAGMSELIATMAQLWKCDSETECDELARKLDALQKSATQVEFMKAYLSMRRMVGDTDCAVLCPDGTTATPNAPGPFA
jgi:hypothetical protein